MGDFNVMLDRKDKIMGRVVITYEIYDFYEFMVYCNIFEMKVKGKKYIWFNGYVGSKIDRALCNLVWVIYNGVMIVDFRECGILDYFFIFIDIMVDNLRGRGILDF